MCDSVVLDQGHTLTSKMPSKTAWKLWKRGGNGVGSAPVLALHFFFLFSFSFLFFVFLFSFSLSLTCLSLKVVLCALVLATSNFALRQLRSSAARLKLCADHRALIDEGAAVLGCCAVLLTLGLFF
jgi:hypothetical protein